MKFLYEGEECTLKGIPNQGLQMISSEGLQKILSNRNQVATMQLCRLEDRRCFNVPVDIAQGQDKRMNPLLLEYSDVFEEPRTLPTHRVHDHKIILKESTTHVNCRPYRHPTVQKDVIEQIAKEMLQAGIIRHSKSSDASLLILLTKIIHSGCIDYRALNNIPLKDKFPIPLIEFD